ARAGEAAPAVKSGRRRAKAGGASSSPKAKAAAQGAAKPSPRSRARRGWDNMSEEEKREWKARKDAEARMLTESVAQAVLSLIERGELDRGLGWKDPWVPPQNIIYGRRYTGVNALALTVQARERGQHDCRFLTLRALCRLKDENGNRAVLNPGAQPYLVITPRRGPDRRLSPSADLSAYEPDRLEYREDGLWLRGQLYFSTVRVFSVADTTAKVPPLCEARLTDFRENEFFERVFEACGMRVKHVAGGGAFFCKADNSVHVPPIDQFDSADLYYATLLHEFYHWTGSPERENRIRRTVFGDREYAREELRAELFAAVCAVMFGLKDVLSHSAGYIAQWNETLQNNPREVITMAAQVQNMASALYDLADGLEPQPAWMRGMDFSKVPTPVLDARRAGMDIEAQWRREMGLEDLDDLQNQDGTLVMRARAPERPASSVSAARPGERAGTRAARGAARSASGQAAGQGAGARQTAREAREATREEAVRGMPGMQDSAPDRAGAGVSGGANDSGAGDAGRDAEEKQRGRRAVWSVSLKPQSLI
ncbi:MAG: zincin-like metallopeptidase domain-containing protein, partial [Desulfovibrionaceae bacterium]|nr:zincin-like metallopeptidase domain-containing protein [Desulfovibrionaceae bacterium]